MKKLLPILITILTILQAKAQKWELTLQGGSTYSHYTGTGAAASSIIVESYTSANQNYTNNPYGKSRAFGYDAGLQLQYVTKSNFIAGLGAGYQMISSKVNIDGVYPALYTVQLFIAGPPPAYPSSGHVNLNNSFFNFSPYVGYRFGSNGNSFDVLPGADIAIPLSSKENGNAIAYDKNYPVDYKKDNLLDIRLKLGAVYHIQKLSIIGGYAHGLLNYTRKQVGGSNPGTYSDVFRLGLGYQLL